MSCTRIAILCALLAASAAAQAQWVWRDARGQTHMSDLPPPRGTPDGQIVRRPSVQARVAPSPGAAPAASAPANAASALTSGDPALEARRKKLADDVAAQRKQQDDKNAAIKSDNCQRARDQLRTLESGQRMQRTTPGGEREILDDAQRAAETQRVRGIVATDCV